MPHSPSPDPATPGGPDGSGALGRRPAALAVEGLGVTVASGRLTAVRDVSFTVGRGEAVGLVGESGSGKTLICRSVLGLLPPGCAVSEGEIALSGEALTGLSRREWDRVRGTRVGAVFQDPASYLNPALTVGRQLTEVLRVKLGLDRARAAERAVELFAAVGLHDPAEVARCHPHELSGGMLQRVLIAVAVACAPDLLVADEATTALDVVVQAEVLELLARMRAEQDLALLLVSHDLAVIAEVCDRILVAYAGELVEDGPAERVLNDPLHPYTEALLRVATVGDWERRELEVIPGAPPEVGARLPGCRFADRCAFAAPECRRGPVPLRETADGRRVRCVRGEEIERSPAGALGTREVAV
ncbi:ABC transporter ATP-binding protein [Streptomyces sp. PSAA01]|uniref:ABC transporter ATP-binding protein n=1 Tax=Streptomyces sp. PSAA01 TaxID=2912762 RepID=UPI001F46AC3C|nr:ABC transporter ATP-binding protein [Streptomyces sp. PSAA01]MCG0284159.1 ABC transporter ATP-binding protein [Streptomyces sp. PSAA01]